MFIWFLNGYRMIYEHIGGIRDPLKQDLAHEFCRNQSKVISILTETHDQIHHIKGNWLDTNFFSSGGSHTKGYLSRFIWVLKISLRLTLIQKGSLCPLRLLLLITEFSAFMPLQGIAPGISRLGGVSLKDINIIWNIKITEMKIQ